MDEDSFWALLEGSQQQTSDPDQRLEALREQLMQRPLPEIAQFQSCLHRVRGRIDTWEMWAAAEQIHGGRCSDDSFWYFQFWVVGLGREAFGRAAADPDSLAEVPELRRLAGRSMETWSDDEWPEWESLDYAAAEAFNTLTGEEEGLETALEAEGLDNPCNPEPSGEAWDVRDVDEASRRLPRLSRMFPLTG
ncbi:DUF4240 domain-containing protein [Streptomyces sp. Ncost-T10-10d]|uniref:DUF4240 domain-containing protein n=1 Tax=Streptomyces sp. Ncost-T10-10d TaxID=1839774 RepID=UPI00081D348F|nr:DUF4240 domain-containing protein [Streptomyces sp. Ncost-T10-10d]SCF97346.1 Protein of unknown function [Streptomyces sp. Ncost-T10-10d]